MQIFGKAEANEALGQLGHEALPVTHSLVSCTDITL